MREPGLDGRHADKNAPKTGQIRLKNSNAINKNLPNPIPGFSPNATVGTMRKETGKNSLADIRKAAQNR